MQRHHVFPFAAAALAASLALGGIASAQVGIEINGSEVDVEPPPIVQAGRVFVPLRGVFENLGASVVYDAGRINATGNGRDIALQIGSNQATVDGQPQTIDVAPFIVGASTYVPLRFVSQALGASVDWDDTDRIVEISLAGATTAFPADTDTDTDVSQAPPPIPAYTPPPCPQQDEVWMPGYWAWGDAGYYWVPGTWVAAPQPGLYWTPGYWAYHGRAYAWSAGFWAAAVGFYGGVNYGAGYYGHGYVGGRWNGNRFQYNTAVAPVNVTVIHNVYVDRTVIVNTTNRISYNGGPGGVAARPTTSEAQVTHERHVAMTPAQQQHVQVAQQDRGLLARVNGGQPPVVAAPHPYTPAAKPAGFTPVQAADRTAAQHLVVRPAAPPAAPVAPAQRVTLPVDRKPVTVAPHPATPAYHAPAAAAPAAAPHPAVPHPAPAHPAALAAPPEHAPAPAAPAYHAPPATPHPPAPAYHAPAPAAPAYHAPAPAAPAYHAPAPAAPAYHSPAPAAPAYHSPAPAAPAYHAPAPAYHAPAGAPAARPVPPAARPAPPATHAAPPAAHSPERPKPEETAPAR